MHKDLECFPEAVENQECAFRTVVLKTSSNELELTARASCFLRTFSRPKTLRHSLERFSTLHDSEERTPFPFEPAYVLITIFDRLDRVPQTCLSSNKPSVVGLYPFPIRLEWAIPTQIALALYIILNKARAIDP
jgi:hypothetical protein